jgi:hypothetical protein
MSQGSAYLMDKKQAAEYLNVSPARGRPEGGGQDARRDCLRVGYEYADGLKAVGVTAKRPPRE